MPSLLLVVAVATSVVNAVGPAALLAWGLAGGDGQSISHWHGGLALLLLASGYYAVFQSFAAFGDIDASRWWLMWALPVLATLGLLLPDTGEQSLVIRLHALWMPTLFTVPPVCIWYADAVA